MQDENRCSRCHRETCPYFAGHRSENAYANCLEATAADAKQARDALLAAGKDQRWAAVYTWLDEHKDDVVKMIVDKNGALERENIQLKWRIEHLERVLSERDCERDSN